MPDVHGKSPNGKEERILTITCDGDSLSLWTHPANSTGAGQEITQVSISDLLIKIGEAIDQKSS